MPWIFTSRAVRELDSIIEAMKINLQNNYKEPAHNERKRLGQRTQELYDLGRINEKTYKKYMQIYNEYTIKLKDYRH